jgi:hypothetical protein
MNGECLLYNGTIEEKRPMIYAILVCVSAAHTYCHLVGRPFLFQSAGRAGIVSC